MNLPVPTGSPQRANRTESFNRPSLFGINRTRHSSTGSCDSWMEFSSIGRRSAARLVGCCSMGLCHSRNRNDNVGSACMDRSYYQESWCCVYLSHMIESWNLPTHVDDDSLLIRSGIIARESGRSLLPHTQSHSVTCNSTKTGSQLAQTSYRRK